MVFSLVMCSLSVAMGETVDVNVPTIKSGGQAKLEVGLSVAEAKYKAFQMDIYLPDGFSMKYGKNGKPELVYSDKVKDVLSTPTTNFNTTKGAYSIAVFQNGNMVIPASVGILFSMTLIAGDNVSDGTYQGKIDGIVFTNLEFQSVHFDAVNFTITVQGKVVAVTLDENSEEALTSTTDPSQVTVKRTIKANEWSTICLPFAMDADEVKTAFGENVQMAEFTEWSCSSEKDSDGNPLSIDLAFSKYDYVAEKGIESNHPYLLKTDQNISSFTVENKTIEADQENAVVEVKMTGGKVRDKGYLSGVYTKGILDSESLFLSGNKIYYAAENTATMKAFRAYFSLSKTLSGYYSGSSAKINLTFNNETTGIHTVETTLENGKIYDISGKYVGTQMKNLPAGLYIQNGKKLIVK